MRWCFSILPCILILLTLGMELCTFPGAGRVKDPSHQACVLDDDSSESKFELKNGLPREDSCLDLDDLNFTGQLVIPRLAKTGLVLSLEKARAFILPSGVRRHRWLCKESC